MGVAAGLAASGKIPFVNTMATFATTRALEAVKIDIAYNAPAGAHRRPRTAGWPPATSARPTTRWRTWRSCGPLPGFTVVVPADATAAEEAVRQTADLPGPVYLRLGRKATPPLDAGPRGRHELGTAQRLRDGGDLVIVACGPHPVLAALGGRRAGWPAGASRPPCSTCTRSSPSTWTASSRRPRRAPAAGHRRGALALRRAGRRGRRDAGRARARPVARDRDARHVRPGRRAARTHLLEHYGITGDRIAEAAHDPGRRGETRMTTRPVPSARARSSSPEPGAAQRDRAVPRLLERARGHGARPGHAGARAGDRGGLGRVTARGAGACSPPGSGSRRSAILAALERRGVPYVQVDTRRLAAALAGEARRTPLALNREISHSRGVLRGAAAGGAGRAHRSTPPR